VKESWQVGSNSKKTPLYDFFVHLHYEPYNVGAWHGTSMFLPAHKWYLWVYESGLIYTAYQHYRAIGIQQEDACKITLPYWDWTLDYDDNLNDTYCPFRDESPLLDANDIGSSNVNPTRFYVQDGLFSKIKDWTLAYKVTDPNYSSYPPDKRLKRVFDCDNFPLTTGPTQAMDAISSYSQFRDFTVWLEAIPHAFPHLSIGMSMSWMYSPDDPIFFLHHSNIDRLYHLWVDCHDYENIPAEEITTAQYEALNPSGSGPGQQGPQPLPTINPITNEIYQVTADTEIPYAWNYPADNVLFPKPWPTPRDMWPSVNGYNGYNVRYGPDNLVSSFGESCTNNQQGWTLVNYPTSEKRSISKSHPHKDKIKKQVDNFKKEIASGKSKREAIRELAIQECTDAPKIKVTQKLLDWIDMNHLSITAFDTLCDKVSERHGNNNANNLNVESTNQKSSSITVADGQFSEKLIIPLWVIITLCAGSTVLLVTVIVLVVLYVRKNKVKYVDDSYREIVDVRKFTNK